jgi:arabinogalactan endo-1,4-beta-galactosidase
MEGIRISEKQTGFIYETSGREFVPWGFNYDHDAHGRLLEDYWEKEWPKVEADFRAMKRLGANCVRIHLQTARFLDSAETCNAASLDRLGRLVALAEQVQLYLDITGLACYRKKDVPAWYDRLSEDDRWKAQARFWEGVAGRCAKSPAVFCYDLMNEPVVPGGARKPGDWLGPPFLGSESGFFVQCIALDQKDRPRPAIARQWCHRLAVAIRQQDRRHLVTVGLVPWSLERPGLTSGFVPKEIAPELDFLCVHIYPSAGKVGEAIDTLEGFSVGKPVVVEEMFPLACSTEELGAFVDQSAKAAQGWIGFYWGKTAEEYRKSATIRDAMVANWLEWFQRRGPPKVGVPPLGGSEKFRLKPGLQPRGFILGADISWVQEQEEEGIRFSDRGNTKDILSLLKDRGFNAVRLRVFNNPRAKRGYSAKGYCDLDHTLRMARRIRAAEMEFLLDFHYSDTWADPGHQNKPAAWTDLHGAELEKAVHDYTRDVLAALKKQGTLPQMVQIGNEISNGFLWPDGNVWKSGKWDVFCGLIKAGIAGAQEVDPALPIMLHLACGGQNAQSRAFLDRAKAEGVRFDVLGQSYYPKWHGTLDDLKSNLTDLAGRYPQKIMVVEYSVPNVRKINDIVHDLPGGKGLGTYIWEPTRWEGPALFDKKGKAKAEIEVYDTMAKDYQNSFPLSQGQ